MSYIPWGNLAVRGKARAVLENSDAMAVEDGPVRMTRILDYLGFSYSEFTAEKETQRILGAIDYASKSIYVNTDESSFSKHMTLAHEIGHAVLHPNESIIDFRSSTLNHLSEDEQRKEREADVFAYELVMPLIEFTRVHKLYSSNLSKIAKHFLVSPVDVQDRVGFLNKQVSDKKITGFPSGNLEQDDS